ncbi:hypothetical protein AK812_SmicGene14082 [Symbiodinium microadriaticum]|uniref:Uncharacterized protein n=1 Tax=Symbiodinium microadriaticum TaxID=2951 RepID=A0A1Q9E6E1_SYMMI|nr:hypothetical protein AK812_SmicGene14082 [Symbiodinium microadriaticum]
MSQFHRNGRMVGLALVMWQVHVTLFASWGNRFEAQRRPAERRAADQGMPMTETRLDVLFLNSLLHPPANNRYLAEVNQFYVSRIHTFGGNCWQLRTLRSSSGTRRIVPIIVNTGGSAYNMPIFNERVRSFFLPDYNKRKGMKGDWRGRRTTDAVQFPTPLGDGISIASGEWDTERAEEIYTHEEGVIYNLVGHELAKVIDECDGLATSKAVKQTAKGFAAHGATVSTIEREVSSMLMDDMMPWDGNALPVMEEGEFRRVPVQSQGNPTVYQELGDVGYSKLISSAVKAQPLRECLYDDPGALGVLAVPSVAHESLMVNETGVDQISQGRHRSKNRNILRSLKGAISGFPDMMAFIYAPLEGQSSRHKMGLAAAFCRGVELQGNVSPKHGSSQKVLRSGSTLFARADESLSTHSSRCKLPGQLKSELIDHVSD